MKIYLAGPMRGKSGWNFDLFARARKQWQDAGHHVYCPALLIEALNYTPDNSAVDRARLNHVLLSDMLCLCNAEAIALLPDWQQSVGATVELAAAQFLKLPVYDALTMELINDIVRNPWWSLPRRVTCI